MAFIELEELTLRNFMSFGNAVTKFNLKRRGTTLIVGENRDDTSEGVGANGVGKAQPLHCRVLVPGGWKTMGEIKVGDMITTPKGHTARVGGVYDQGMRPVYKLTFQDGRTALCDENHLWKVKLSDGEFGVASLLVIQALLQANVSVAIPLVSGIAHEGACTSCHDLSPKFGMFVRHFKSKVRAEQHQARTWMCGKVSYLNEEHINGETVYVVSAFDATGLNIVKCEFYGTEPTRCIMVEDEDHLYVTDDFIVTHNTTIINAISYALYDKPVSKISKKDGLINNINLKQMEVTLKFTIDHKTKVTIRRVRKDKSGADANAVWLEVDGVDKTVDSRGTNAAIERLIGIPYELFVRIVVFSASNTPFLDLPQSHPTAPNQRDVVEELFGLTVLSDRSAKLKLAIKDEEGRMQLLEQRISSQEEELARHQSLIDSTKKRIDTWEQQKIEQIAHYEQQLQSVAGVDLDAERLIHTQLNQLLVDLKTLNGEISTESDAIQQKQRSHAKLVKELDDLLNATCPYCKQGFHGNQDKALEVGQQVEQLKVEIDNAKYHQEQRELAYEKQYAEMLNVKSKKTIEKLSVLENIVQQQGIISAKLDAVRISENPHIEALADLTNAAPVVIDYTELNETKKYIEHQKFLLKLLMKNESFVRKSLVNGNLTFLNSKLAEYIQFLGLPFRVKFEQDMSCSIAKFGRDIEFGNLSAGQRARVNLAISFAFKDVRERMSNHINVCMMDEALDHGLDSVGISVAAKLIKEVARKNNLAMFVITHRDEIKSVFDRVVTVVMKDGFSTIEE